MGGNRPAPGQIDWQRLLREFEAFEPDDDFKRIDAEVFRRSLADPLPPFVGAFLAQKLGKGIRRSKAVRDLYGFLLEKRYSERLNLIHFAFEIFDGTTCLPPEIVDRTPLPHEDGLPKYRLRWEPGFTLNLKVA